MRENFPLPKDSKDILEYLEYCIRMTAEKDGKCPLLNALIGAWGAVARSAGPLTKAA